MRAEAESRGTTVTDCDVAESRDVETNENITDGGLLVQLVTELLEEE